MVTLTTTALHPPEKVNTRHRDTKTHSTETTTETQTQRHRKGEKTGTYTENLRTRDNKDTMFTLP